MRFCRVRRLIRMFWDGEDVLKRPETVALEPSGDRSFALFAGRVRERADRRDFRKYIGKFT